MTKKYERARVPLNEFLNYNGKSEMVPINNPMVEYNRLSSITCDLCNVENKMVSVYIENNYTTIEKTIGYGHSSDGNTYTLDVCPDCLIYNGTNK